MEKPVIVPIKEDFHTNDGYDNTVSYGNLFASYTVEQKLMDDEDTITTSTSQTTNLTMNDYSMEFESSSPTSPSTMIIRRPERNGEFTFKENSEYELMIHVQQGLGKCDFSSLTQVEAANVVLSSVDDFCMEKQWMYHVGHEKGETLKKFLGNCINTHKNSPRRNRRLGIVELGSYCGYSAILLAKSVKELAPELDFHVYSTEINEQNRQVAKSMILLAKLQKYITILPFQPSCEGLSTLLKRHVIQIDFLFLDL